MFRLGNIITAGDIFWFSMEFLDFSKSGFWNFRIFHNPDFKIFGFFKIRILIFWAFENPDLTFDFFVRFLKIIRKFRTSTSKFLVKFSENYFVVTIFFRTNRQVPVRSVQKHTFAKVAQKLHKAQKFRGVLVGYSLDLVCKPSHLAGKDRVP